MYNVVVLTPTYNRVDTLPILYNSLCVQNCKDFLWLVVDDGSTDNTKLYIESLIEENKINIQYVYQQNGGKARALNHGFSLCKSSELVMVVDSDDYLLPDAVGIAADYLEKYSGNENIGGFFFHYRTTDGKILKPKGKIIKQDEIMTIYEYNKTYGKHDGCLCYLNKSIEQYRYPEFIGENYIGPTVIQMEMAEKFKIVYSPKIIGVAEYQEGGLTKSGRELRLKNPLGMMYYCRLMMSHKSSFTTQIKYAISIWPYAKVAGKSYLDLVKFARRPLLLFITYIPGMILTRYWGKYLTKK